MEFKLITTLTGFDELAGEWNGLLGRSVSNSPFLRHEYLRAWWLLLGGGEWRSGELAVVCAYLEGELVAIAPLFSTQNRDKEPALMLLGSIEISDFLDLIAPEEYLPAFAAGLLEQLNGMSAWKAIDLYNIPQDSATITALQSAGARRGWQSELTRLQPAPYIPLPGDFDAYLAGIEKKQRHEIRRKMRRASESDQAVRWYIVEDEGSLDGEMEAFLDLMAQDEEKAAFLTDVMRTQMKTAVHAAFREGWLQLAFLEVDGRKACGYLNFDYDNRVWVYNSGLDFEFGSLSPGWVLLGHLLQWANENGREEFDFMRGGEDYKYRFGAQERYVMRLKLSR